MGMNSLAVLAAFFIIFNKPEVVVEVGQIDRSLRVSEGQIGFGGGEPLPWDLRTADPSIAVAHRFPDDHFDIRGVSPGITGIPRSTGGYHVRIKVVCGAEAPVTAEQPRIKTRAGETVQLRAVTEIADRTTFQWYEGHSGDTSHPIATGGAELPYTASAAAKQYVWVLATTACTSSAAEFELEIAPSRRRAAGH